jgi:hypothetical protein
MKNISTKIWNYGISFVSLVYKVEGILQLTLKKQIKQWQIQ